MLVVASFPDMAFPTSQVAKLEDGLGQSYGIVEEMHVDSGCLKMSRCSRAAANRMGKLWSAPSMPSSRVLKKLPFRFKKLPDFLSLS